MDDRTRRLVHEAGLTIVEAVVEDAMEDGVPVTWLWLVARKGLKGEGSAGPTES